ncbi:hypothetical protein SKAU_G00394190 [Synaphobranchus kaupii]|uniref:Uncharacterized protein n=1 Tax=Synaphobranchus kaupii TaxID=118154 RepID=A0A9Q1IDX7_SYNKA|nr:hypothetical protein SKAU_G00394190 [Synaphobranchus kaupii]
MVTGPHGWVQQFLTAPVLTVNGAGVLAEREKERGQCQEHGQRFALKANTANLESAGYVLLFDQHLVNDRIWRQAYGCSITQADQGGPGLTASQVVSLHQLRRRGKPAVFPVAAVR